MVARWLLALLVGCGASHTVHPCPEPRAAAEQVEAAPLAASPDREAWVDALIGDIRRLHVFSDAWPRESWDKHVPDLRAAILDDAAIDAL